MLDNIDLASVVKDCCTACNIEGQILSQHQLHKYSVNMDRRDHSTQLHFEILLLYRCILFNEIFF